MENLRSEIDQNKSHKREVVRGPLNDCSKTFYCTIPHGIGETFQGSTPTAMFMPPLPCEIHLDLDSVDITLPGNDYRDTIYCSLPHKLLLSIPDLFSNKQWDSLSVWIKQGPPGIFLEGISPLFANLTGNQTDRLKYYRTSLSEFKSLEPFINEILLTGQMPDNISDLKIGFTAWAGSLQSDTAFAYITLINRTTSAGKDNFIKLCLSDIPIHLSTLLSKDATLGGQWKPSLTQSDLFQPKTDSPGDYIYVINDPKCEPDTAEFLIETNPKIVFDLGLNRLICPGDTTQFNLNLVNVEYLWSDGSSNSSISINEPQTVSVIITDDIGCTYGDSVQVVYDENCITEFYIPNIFSPDGNGLNDEWIINGGPGISLEINIFDRWGNMIFYQSGESIHWNGITRNNIKVQEGVYVYRLKILSENQNEIVKTGDITLIR